MFVDISSWKRGLKVKNNTWVLIDRGTNVIAVWDIINTNHRRELGDVVEVLKATWGKVKEQLYKSREPLVQPNAIKPDRSGAE